MEMRRKLIRAILLAGTCLGIAGSLLPSVASSSTASVPYQVQPVVNAPLPESHGAFVELVIANFEVRAANDVRLQFYTQSSGGPRHAVVPGLPIQPPISGLPSISHRPHLRGKTVDLGRLPKGKHVILGVTLPCLPNMHLELSAGSKHYDVSKQAGLNAMLEEVC
jgi:hypothetical protein